MKTLKDLKARYLAYNKIKYPSLPDHARTIPAYFKRSKETNGLTRLILCAIRLKGWQAERISSSGRMIDNTRTVKNVLGMNRQIGSKKWIKSTSQNGTADISTTINGQSVKIEVKNKATKDKMSEAQENYKKMILITGGIYYVASDIESFLVWLDGFPNNENILQAWEVLGI